MENIIKLFAKLQLDGKEYKILKLNDDKIVFAVSESNRNRLDLTDEEKILFSQFYNSLRVSKKTSLKLENKKLNNRNIEIFFDYRTHLHYWYEIIDGNRYEIDEKTNKILNFRYNHINDYVADEIFNESSKSDYSDNNFFKRYIRIGKEKIAVLIAAGLSMSTLMGCTLSQGVEINYNQSELSESVISTETTQTSEATYETTTEAYSFIQLVPLKLKNDSLDAEINRRSKQQYDWEKIKSAVESNQNLQANDKKLILSLKFLFDIKDIEYVDDVAEVTNISGATGAYNYTENRIVYQNGEEKNPGTKVHELMHVLQVDSLNSSPNGRLIKELSNERLSRETNIRLKDEGAFEYLGLIDTGITGKYFYTDCSVGYGGSGYEEFMPLGLILAECLNQEQLKLYQFFSSDEVLVESLIQLEEPTCKKEEFDEQLKRAYKLLDDYDELQYIYSISSKSNPEYIEKEKEIENTLSYYYEKKNNKLVTDTIVPGAVFESPAKSNAYFELMVEQAYNWNEKWCYGSYFGIRNKTYFSNYYPYPVIYYSDGSGVQTGILQIDEKIEKIYEQKCKEEREKSIENDFERE